MGRTHQEAAPSPPVALGPASCPLPGDPALSPLLTWAGRGPRHGAGCKGWWPGPPQTGARRASGTAGPPGHLHTDLGVPSRSPEAEGKPQSVHACTLHPTVRGSNHPFTWHCMSQSPRLCARVQSPIRELFGTWMVIPCVHLFAEL